MGLYKAVKKAVPDVPIMVMIRPRVGDFLYSKRELEVMLEDIATFKALKADGVVFGALTRDATVNVLATTQLAQAAHPMEVCFHRAVDMALNLTEAFHEIKTIPGITRVLTSGQGKTAPSDESLANLKELFRMNSVNEHKSSVLSILPGSGINPQTIGVVLDTLLPLGLREVHLSAGGWLPSDMVHRPEGMGMGVGGEGEWGIWRTNAETVREVRHAMDEAWKQYSVSK
ncbi:copper homeostasis CutC domain-containing protein [Phanerochaete sordida]|uniref:Copper homeostasis protein cutC homolog n=1 Tax=Phanerochaete sordida TaxID=48140 RepID=A0A9P3G776_9APHY|nr:copper homeostasis CutC domain-containing protein [Phanerochaete sordida]